MQGVPLLLLAPQIPIPEPYVLRHLQDPSTRLETLLFVTAIVDLCAILLI